MRELRVSAPLQAGQIDPETGALRINGLEVFVPPGLRAQLGETPHHVSVTVARAESGQLSIQSITRPADAADGLGESIRLKAVLRLPEEAPSQLTMRDTEVQGFAQALAASPSCSAVSPGESGYVDVRATCGRPGGAPPLRVELPPESALSSETARELVGQRIGLDFERRQGAAVLRKLKPPK